MIRTSNKRKTAVITGAASGIGLAVARAFVSENAQAVLCDVNEEKLKQEAGNLGCSFYCCDLSTKTSCKELVQFAVKTYRKVDILVNVAGIQTVSPIKEFPEDKWDFMISLMLTAPFLLTKYVWPYMAKNNWGRIINMNSIHGLVASHYKAAYVSAKHGLAGLTKVAALEGGERGITVNSICPSYVRTPLLENQIESQAKAHGISPDEVIHKIMLQKAAVPSLIEPETIARIVLFLCSDEAAHITGITLPVDGGWTAQ